MSVASDGTRMREDTVGLLGSIATVVTTMAPAVSALYTVPFLAATSGVVSPSLLIAAAIIGLMLGYTLAQLARHIVSTGSYYTYISVLFGKRLGFLVGWVYLLFYPVAAGMLGALFGYTVQTVMQAHMSWSIPWWVLCVLFIGVITGLAWLGIQISLQATVGLGAIEVLIIVVLAVWGLADPGKGGTNFKWLDVLHGGSGHALFLGFVFSIYSFVGFDASVPLAEETRHPKKIVPLAAMGSIVAMMVFLVLTTWGEFSGWGTDNLATMATSAEAPAFVLARHYWGILWLLVLLAALNSIIGASLACVNASARILYSMGRTGVLHRSLATVSSRTGAPVGGLILQTAVSLLVGLGLSAAVGVANIYGFTGLLFTFSLALVFVVANAAALKLYRTTALHEFSWWKHVLIPIVTTAGLGIVVYYSVVPWPASPFDWALPSVAIWLALGVVVLAVRMKSIDSSDFDSVLIESPIEARATMMDERHPTADLTLGA